MHELRTATQRESRYVIAVVYQQYYDAYADVIEPAEYVDKSNVGVIVLRVWINAEPGCGVFSSMCVMTHHV